MAQKRFSPAGPSQRQLRVGELIRRRLSEVLARADVHDPELNRMMITVGEVRTSPDLKIATAYVMPLGGRGRDEALAAVRRNRHELRRLVATALSLKYAPELRFAIDETFDRMDETRALLARADVRRDIEAPQDEETDMPPKTPPPEAPPPKAPPPEAPLLDPQNDPDDLRDDTWADAGTPADPVVPVVDERTVPDDRYPLADPTRDAEGRPEDAMADIDPGTAGSAADWDSGDDDLQPEDMDPYMDDAADIEAMPLDELITGDAPVTAQLLHREDVEDAVTRDDGSDLDDLGDGDLDDDLDENDEDDEDGDGDDDDGEEDANDLTPGR